MDKQSEKFEKLTQKWVSEAGVEQPSSSFVSNVMQAVEQRAKMQKEVRPLVSKRAWMGVAAFIVGVAALFYFFPTGDTSYLEKLPLNEIPQFNNPFKGLEVSKPMVYAIGFLALFLVQIPFLRRRFIN